MHFFYLIRQQLKLIVVVSSLFWVTQGHAGDILRCGTADNWEVKNVNNYVGNAAHCHYNLAGQQNKFTCVLNNKGLIGKTEMIIMNNLSGWSAVLNGTAVGAASITSNSNASLVSSDSCASLFQNTDITLLLKNIGVQCKFNSTFGGYAIEAGGTSFNCATAGKTDCKACLNYFINDIP